MTIPNKNPNISTISSSVLASLTAEIGNADVANKILANLNPAALHKMYEENRNSVIDATLAANTSLAGTKVTLDRIPANATAKIDPNGTASIVAASGKGCVTVQATLTFKIHADNIAGLIPAPTPVTPVKPVTPVTPVTPAKK